MRLTPRLLSMFVALALAGGASGCVNSRGNLLKGSPILFDALPQSADDADYVCEKELPRDTIYPQPWARADGLSAEQQRNRYYQRCMARHGHPEASVARPSPPLSPDDEQADKLIKSIQQSM